MDYRDNRSYNGGAANGGINNNGRPNYSKPRTSHGPRRPATPKGHDAILKEIQDLGLVMTVMFLDGESATGKLTARDKFTITISDSYGATTYYKHALKGFRKGE